MDKALLILAAIILIFPLNWIRLLILHQVPTGTNISTVWLVTIITTAVGLTLGGIGLLAFRGKRQTVREAIRAQGLQLIQAGAPEIERGRDEGLPMTDVGDVRTVSCPYCAEPILAAAKKCKHCGEFLDPRMRDGAIARAMPAGPAPVRQRVSFPHWLHVILTIATMGLWLIPYILIWGFRDRNYYL